uniref:DHHA1 domain-containing protein n=1 Tax=Desulfobacca acetoxidans TaxID=60893 RepID=A0A7V4LD67_9BACT
MGRPGNRGIYRIYKESPVPPRGPQPPGGPAGDGGGGGRPNLAQAGGRDSSKLPEALTAARQLIADTVQR